jgi:uncharacterized OB-fold protein
MKTKTGKHSAGIKTAVDEYILYQAQAVAAKDGILKQLGKRKHPFTICEACGKKKSPSFKYKRCFDCNSKLWAESKAKKAAGQIETLAAIRALQVRREEIKKMGRKAR